MKDVLIGFFPLNRWKKCLYDRIIAAVKNTRVRDQEERNKNFNIY